MRLARLIALALLGAASLLVPAGAALASTRATSAQASAVAKAVGSSTVGGINKVPTKRYKVGDVWISTVSKAWAMASLVANKGYQSTFQAATVLRRSTGRNARMGRGRPRQRRSRVRDRAEPGAG